jgi:hypothetical protein
MERWVQVMTNFGDVLGPYGDHRRTRGGDELLVFFANKKA